MRMTRRAVLAGGGVALAGGLSGCGASTPDDSNTEDRQPTPSEAASKTEGAATSTATETATMRPEAIAFEAGVRHQPTEDQPGVVTVSLRNEQSVPIRFTYGPKFLLMDAREPVSLWHEEGFLEFRDGCWRLPPSGPTRVFIATTRQQKLDPGDSMERAYPVFTRAEECLPPGKYGFPGHLNEAGTSRSFDLRMLLVVNGGRLSVATKGPTLAD